MEILIITILILLNGVFAMSEMAIVTSRKSRLRQLAKSGNKKAKVALEIAEEPNNFLSTIQVGITLIAILSGAFAGETLVNPLSEFISNYSYLDKYSQLISIGIIVSLITFLSLIFGELVPKRIALKYPEKIASLVAIPMKLISIIAAPLVLFLTVSTDFVLRILRLNKTNKEGNISREEIKFMLAEGVYQGSLPEDEVKMINSVFKLNDLSVRNVMNPLSKIIFLDKNTSITRVIEITKMHQHSRYPVYDGEKENVIGFIHIKDIYLKMISDGKKLYFGRIYQLIHRFKGDQKLKDFKIIRPIKKVNQDMKIDDAMVFLKNKAAHIALVKDDNDKTVGIVSLEDIFEKVVGEIKDEYDILNKN